MQTFNDIKQNIWFIYDEHNMKYELTSELKQLILEINVDNIPVSEHQVQDYFTIKMKGWSIQLAQIDNKISIIVTDVPSHNVRFLTKKGFIQGIIEKHQNQ